jgi:glutamate racemase
MQEYMGNTHPTQNLVGIFDSGVGGLSVLREIRNLLPSQPLLFIGDQAHVPYGKRQLSEIQEFSFAITRHLLDDGARLIVVACNTASAAALKALRLKFPDVPFVGMEPAVKPASQQTRNGVVGVLATPATFQGELYNTLVEKFARNVRILTGTLPGLVEEIENGNLDGPQTHAILEEAIRPMLAEGADTLVLGCTHFPFVLPLIREIAGPQVNVIDPSPAIARRTKALLQDYGWENPPAEPAAITFTTTGDLAKFKTVLQHLLGVQAEAHKLTWDAKHLKNP